jgi:hypothetical protein
MSVGLLETLREEEDEDRATVRRTLQITDRLAPGMPLVNGVENTMSVSPGICGTSTTTPTCSCLQSLIDKAMERLSTSDRYSAAL